MPLFEAVVNSIQALEEAGIATDKGEVTVEIIRDDSPTLPFDAKTKKRGPDPTARILGFRVTDNGIGFNAKNFESFETLDSEHKASQGCRGVGRLLWLKAFDKVHVDSVYLDGGTKKRRKKFSFDDQNAIFALSDNPAGDADERKTAVHLHGFEKTYREASFKTIDTIARALFEHCLWYFVRPGGAPSIRIIDGDESIGLDEVYDSHMADSTKMEDIKIKGIDFELTHVKLHVTSAQTHKIAYCAANRVVKEEPINGKINGLYGKITDENGTFIYGCYVRSKFLDANVRADRTDLTIDEVRDGMFADVEISMSDIRKAILGAVESHLSPLLQENKRLVRERVDDFVNTSAPRYKSIIPRLSADKLNIDPEMPNKELDVHLHKCLAEIENKMLADGHDIMIPKDIESLGDYQRRVDSYLSTIEDIKKSDLASYVSHRKVILDLLEKALVRNPDGTVAREDLIHKLIAPMGSDSTEMDQNQCNLWLLDERLTFHDYLASDKTLRSMPITGATETKEPDFLALNVYDNPLLVAEGTSLPLASITVIELKRPLRDDAREGEEKDPIEQALGYLDRVRRGTVTTAKGRLIPNSEHIPGFCYVIADLTPSLETRCKMKDLKVTSDKMGWFGYNDNYNAYIEVISFDRLVRAAKERNRAFFDRLGLPVT
jgi:hypothetical protein